MEPQPPSVPPGSESAIAWIEQVLPRTMRWLVDGDNLDMPLLQLPLAQLRLAQALFDVSSGANPAGESMGNLSSHLGVKQNALTQAADRLIQRGLAERIGDPHDRRIVRMRLTDLGKSWVSARRKRRSERFTRIWKSLDDTERQKFVNAVEFLESVTMRIERADDPTGAIEGSAAQAARA